MKWLTPRYETTQWRKDEYASKEEMTLAFQEQRSSLLWVATVIAGNADLADQAIADAVQATAPSFIFREFLRASVWRAVACAAADATRDLIAASAKHYYETGAEQFDRKLLTAAELSCMQKLPPSQLIGEFDPFARAVLIFCGLLGASIFDCAAVLGVHRKCVAAAFRAIRKWVADLTLVRPNLVIAEANKRTPVMHAATPATNTPIECERPQTATRDKCLCFHRMAVGAPHVASKGASSAGRQVALPRCTSIQQRGTRFLKLKQLLLALTMSL